VSLQPHSGAEIPPLTARVARAASPKGTTAMWIRDRLDGLWSDEEFTAWYPRDGRPGLSPAQIAIVCVLAVRDEPLRPSGRRGGALSNRFQVRPRAPRGATTPSGGKRTPPLACRSRLVQLRAA
jgi:hypothetical protein